jgi:hypothetical protein
MNSRGRGWATLSGVLGGLREYRRSFGRRGFRVSNGAQCRDGVEDYPAMTNRANADFLQILLRQLRQDALADLVLAKASLILSKAKASEPVADIPWSSAAVGHNG